MNWYHLYLEYFKNNIYLYVMLILLLVLTVGLWYWIPFYLFTVLSNLTLHLIIFHLFLGCFFSIFLLNINLKASKAFHKQKSYITLFLKIQGSTIFLFTVLAFIVNYFYWIRFL
ncbi:hypothetical protein AZF04_03070 [Alkalihalobacillus trypoxylicola]|uniref:Uncharacterized protein n=1 Tax=Alkalihalobacillus trypoxylicola TaxID=519424 RepID=A0A162E5F6_9BACI|nr:hypothetical protein AZF04_03070 [Alkalihalobacillus trypoxylicola]